MIEEKGYGDILEKVLRDVKDRKEGVLYACIEIMAPENLDEIIEHFKISQSAPFYDDLQVLNNVPSFQPILKRVDPMSIRSLSVAGLAQKTLGWNLAGSSVGLIIVAALVVVSLWIFQQRNDMGPIGWVGKKLTGNRPGNNKNENDLQETISIRSQDEKCEADLWLVIPCKRIQLTLQNRLRKDGEFSADETITLVDKSVYFLATASKDDYSPEIKLDGAYENFPESSDLFVRLHVPKLHVPEGTQLRGIDLKRGLSRAISDKEQSIIVRDIGLLNDFNSLQKFHRA